MNDWPAALLCWTACVRTRPLALPPRKAGGRSCRWFISGMLAAAFCTSIPDTVGQTPEGGTHPLQPVVVAATRAPQFASEVPIPVTVFTAEQIRSSPALTIDSVLRESAAFSLFRRSSSLSANPTAQGVSLRGIGPSGASRTLVLLDGIPLNDPFGGWVNWSKVPRSGVDRAEIVRGGGSSSWGSSALGGTIALYSSTLRDERRGGWAEAGSFGTARLSGEAVVVGSQSVSRFDASVFRTDGFQPVIPSRRGSVDRALSSEHQTAQFVTRRTLTPDLEASLTLRGFNEERDNGTVLQNNTSREGLIGLGVERRSPHGWQWALHSYAQVQRFSSFFSSVAGDRASETPASDQYSVPATAAGFSLTGAAPRSEHSSLSWGLDFRHVDGETRERFLYSGNRFTRERRAGGEQQFSGVFAAYDRRVWPGWTVSAAARADRWENRDGRRREWDTITGSPTRSDTFPSNDDVEFSPRVGLHGPLGPRLRGRIAAYRAFRVPTLNEYYRPFRVGNVNTEANAALQPETLDGVEAGLEGNTGSLRWQLTGFQASLSDAVANTTVDRSGPVVQRQRRNLDEVRIRGLEAGLSWPLSPQWRLVSDYLLSQSEIREASQQRGLEGLRLAQAPRHTVTAGVTFVSTSSPDQPGTVEVDARGRYVSDQYEDDENTLVLADAITVDVQVQYRLTETVTLFAILENATDTAVETSRSADGLVTYDAPRRWRLGARARF